MNDVRRCEICGELMPEGEEMFKFHGFSGPCPKPPLPSDDGTESVKAMFKNITGVDEPSIDKKGRVVIGSVCANY